MAQPGPEQPLARAKTSAEVYLEDNCFDAQQAAEKAIKAIFIHRGEKFPYIHNLKDLLQRLQRNGLKVPKYVHKAHELTRFASEPRYPGSSGPVSKREHRHFVRIAEAVFRWAQRQIGKP
jgi:HEPN domain-containing protein